MKTNEEEGKGLKQRWGGGGGGERGGGGGGGWGALNSGFTVYMYTTKHFTNM